MQYEKITNKEGIVCALYSPSVTQKNMYNERLRRKQFYILGYVCVYVCYYSYIHTDNHIMKYL